MTLGDAVFFTACALGGAGLVWLLAESWRRYRNARRRGGGTGRNRAPARAILESPKARKATSSVPPERGRLADNSEEQELDPRLAAEKEAREGTLYEYGCCGSGVLVVAGVCTAAWLFFEGVSKGTPLGSPALWAAMVVAGVGFITFLGYDSKRLWVVRLTRIWTQFFGLCICAELAWAGLKAVGSMDLRTIGIVIIVLLVLVLFNQTRGGSR